MVHVVQKSVYKEWFQNKYYVYIRTSLNGISATETVEYFTNNVLIGKTADSLNKDTDRN